MSESQPKYQVQQKRSSRPVEPERAGVPLVLAEPERPPYLMAAAVALGALLLYVVTLAPTTQFWDTSEYLAPPSRSTISPHTTLSRPAWPGLSRGPVAR